MMVGCLCLPLVNSLTFVSPFKVLYCIQMKKENLQRTENEGVGNESVLTITASETLHFKNISL